MASPRPSRSQPRIEYLGFRNVDGAREYAYAVHAPEGSSEFRLRILLAAFAASHVLLQDGPDGEAGCHDGNLLALYPPTIGRDRGFGPRAGLTV